MTALILRRVDAVKHMHRYYRPDMQPDLFGQWCLVREWGRIGSAGQTRSVPFPTPIEAQAGARTTAQDEGAARILLMLNAEL